MPAPVLLRPAIIELRYKDDAEFQAAVKLYEKVLQYTQEISPDEKTRVFVVGLAENGKRKDLLLRLSNVEQDPGTKRTLIYWYVKGQKKVDLDSKIEVINRLLPTVDGTNSQVAREESSANDEYSGLPPAEPPTPGDYDIGRILLMQGMSSSYLGLTINPPVPTLTLSGDEASAFHQAVKNNKGRDKYLEIAHLLPWAIVALLIMLGVCALSFWFGKKWEKNKRSKIRHMNVTMTSPAA